MKGRKMKKTDEFKSMVAKTAVNLVTENIVLGVGTGTTVEYFIKELGKKSITIECAVSSSNATSKLLENAGIKVEDYNNVGNLDIYIDGADEATKYGYLIKGGGGALTREKILASGCQKFICMVDSTKIVEKLGNFPLPIEVIPMARSHVARELVKLGGSPEWRMDTVTDNGNWILDVFNLDLSNASEIESKLNNIPGVVCNGIFAKRPCDKLLVGGESGVTEITP